MLVLGLVACAAAPASVTARADPADPGGITVTGTATVEAAPDTAELVATVSAESPTPAEATHRVRERQAALLAGFSAAGVAPADVAVSWLNLQPVLEQVGGRSRVRGYAASIAITATTRDFDALADLLERAAEAGATEVSTRFRVADLPAVKARARDTAVAAARAKGEQLAADLGVHLGPVRSVTESPEPMGWGFGNENVRVTLADDAVHGQAEAVSVSVVVGWDLAP